MTKCIYDVKDEDALLTQGYEPNKGTTLMSKTKEALIDQIRCLEHNWAVEIKANKLLSYRLKKFADILTYNGHPEKFHQICALPGEYKYNQDDFEPNINYFCEGRDDYWFHSWLKSQKKIKAIKDGIQDIKRYTPFYYDKDLAEWFELDVDYLINNSIEGQILEEEELIDDLPIFKRWDLEEMACFTKEEQKNGCGYNET